MLPSLISSVHTINEVILLLYIIQYNILMNLQFILLQTGSEILQNGIASRIMYLSFMAMKDVPWKLILRGISQ